ILDTAEVKMAFCGYTMFLGNNNLHAHATDLRSQPGWIAKHFTSNARCAALTQNEWRPSDRANIGMCYSAAFALVGPTQIVPSAPTTPNPPTTSSNNGTNSNSTQPPQTASADQPPKFDPEIVLVSRTHRLQKDVSAIAEVYSLNPPMSNSTP